MRYFITIIICLLFTQAVSPQNFTTSNLPLIFINTQGKTIPDEPKLTALMKVINNANKVNNINDEIFEYEGYIGIETRGNTSQMFFDKKSFSVETRTDSGTNRNVSLLGLPEENDWVLYGPYTDKSLIRNVLAYHLGNSQGWWSPRTRYCEVFINNEYRGVYVLTEKIKIDKNRVNIATLKPEDNSGDELTGGYIMRIDRDRPGSWNSPFMGRTGSVDVPISYLDPPYDELTIQQRAYIRDYITDFEYALDGNDFKDPEVGYRAFIDLISFIDYFIISELSRNLDGYRCSVYFHKDKDSKGGKLNMSPLWDYDLCFGNGDFFEAFNPVGWVADGLGKGDWYEIPFWWDKLREDPYFNTFLKYRWNELRGKEFSNANIDAFIDSCANVLNDAQKRNFQKFDILGSYVWPNPYIGGSYLNEIDYLKNWIDDRFSWLDSQFDLIIPLSVNEEATGFFANRNQLVIYPNPFTEKVTLRFNLPKNAAVDIIIRNVLGEKMMHQSKVCSPGNNEFIFTSEEFNQNGNLFFYTLVVDGEIVQSGKMINSNARQ
jgi:hypothetical protein